MDNQNRPNITSQTLARKLQLIQDTAIAEGGREYRYPDVKGAMAEAGTPLSRARWHYLRNGTGSDPRDVKLLTNLAAYFQVDTEFLLMEDSDVPARIAAQMEPLRLLREERIRQGAIANIDGLSPRLLRELRGMIDARLEAAEDKREVLPPVRDPYCRG